jgi:hypothetical protein
MTPPERLSLARPLSILPHVVRQHATQKCVRTPMKTADTPLKSTNKPAFHSGSQRPRRRNRHSPTLPAQAIWRPLKSHS